MKRKNGDGDTTRNASLGVPLVEALFIMLFYSVIFNPYITKNGIMFFHI